MGVQLLDKTRKINKLLHNNSSSKVVFNDICEVLTEILNSNVLVISKKGKVLGGSKCEGVPYITELIEREIGKHVDDMLNERLLSILSTKENVNLQTLGFSEEAVKGYQAIITPIDIAGERLGTLFIYKKDKVYEIDDIILSEYGTTVVGLEMLRSVNEESADNKRPGFKFADYELKGVPVRLVMGGRDLEKAKLENELNRLKIDKQRREIWLLSLGLCFVVPFFLIQ